MTNKLFGQMSLKQSSLSDQKLSKCRGLQFRISYSTVSKSFFKYSLFHLLLVSSYPIFRLTLEKSHLIYFLISDLPIIMYCQLQ